MGRILITGASGNVGRYVAQYALEQVMGKNLGHFSSLLKKFSILAIESKRERVTCMPLPLCFTSTRDSEAAYETVKVSIMIIHIF